MKVFINMILIKLSAVMDISMLIYPIFVFLQKENKNWGLDRKQTERLREQKKARKKSCTIPIGMFKNRGTHNTSL